MKKYIITLSFAFSALCSAAQSTKYEKAMTANLLAIDSSFKSPLNLLTLSNNFERIATVEKNQWLPYYYAAFLQVNYAFMEQDKTKTDPIADKAESLINKADSLSPNNSEISCIKSMIASVRMIADPMTRYMKYGQLATAELEKAKMQDPSNPRPYMIAGQNLRYTPEQFGGGCANALPDLTKAKEKFSTFKPLSEFHPSWGANRVEDLITGCNK